MKKRAKKKPLSRELASAQVLAGIALKRLWDAQRLLYGVAGKGIGQDNWDATLVALAHVIESKGMVERLIEDLQESRDEIEDDFVNDL